MFTTETEAISNTQDVIDSRDVIKRIDYLESFEVDEATEDTTELDGEHFELDGSEIVELQSLRNLRDEAEGYAPDWKYGEALILDSYFEDYAQQLAEDIGAIDKNASWPNNCIDWEKATRELQYDYMAVDFDGATYWIRA